MACDGSEHASQAAANAVDCAPPVFTACDGSEHASQAAADAVSCTNPTPETTCIDGEVRDGEYDSLYYDTDDWCSGDGPPLEYGVDTGPNPESGVGP